MNSRSYRKGYFYFALLTSPANRIKHRQCTSPVLSVIWGLTEKQHEYVHRENIYWSEAKWKASLHRLTEFIIDRPTFVIVQQRNIGSTVLYYCVLKKVLESNYMSNDALSWYQEQITTPILSRWKVLAGDEHTFTIHNQHCLLPILYPSCFSCWISPTIFQNWTSSHMKVTTVILHFSNHLSFPKT